MSRVSGKICSPHWIGFARATAVAVALGVAMDANAASVPDYPRLFGMREARSSDLSRFSRWTGMLDRYLAEIGATAATCAETGLDQCHSRYWGKFLDNLRGAGPMTQLEQINRYMNEAPYVADSRNYDRPDYWATPREFFDRSGDCEDYAIAKFMSLRALGWENERLRIAVVRNLDRGIIHAVLVAYLGGKAWVLDNEMKRIVAADRILHYRPYYSINEDGWWRHSL